MTIDYPHFEHAALTRFAPLAAAYCDLLDRAADLTAEILMQEVLRLLPQLYSGALALPPTGVLFDADAPENDDDDTAASGPDVSPDPDDGNVEEWMAALRRLAALLGPVDYYREVFDPYEPSSAPEVTGSLADDLREIHRELRRGLRKWQRGETGEALWEWRFGFEYHWGEHLTGALRAIHVRCSTYDLPWPPMTPGSA